MMHCRIPKPEKQQKTLEQQYYPDSITKDGISSKIKEYLEHIKNLKELLKSK